MDYKKDMQERGVAGYGSSNSMDSFNIMLSKKCERLATASYLVTNFLSDMEPLKPRLRTLSLELVREASFSKGGHSSIEANVFDALRANISETLSLFELAFVAGLVSEMNFTILKREYVALRDTIDIKKASRESRTDSILGDTFFGASFRQHAPLPSKIKHTPIAPQSHVQNKSLSDVSDRMSDSMSDTNTSPAPRVDTNTPTRAQIGGASKTDKGHSKSQKVETIVSPKSQSSSSSVVLVKTVDQEARRTRILKLIKDNREVSIKDIVAYFPELSDKTIQRELVSLTESGVLKKTGERRWSRYSIA